MDPARAIAATPSFAPVETRRCLVPLGIQRAVSAAIAALRQHARLGWEAPCSSIQAIDGTAVDVNEGWAPCSESGAFASLFFEPTAAELTNELLADAPVRTVTVGGVLLDVEVSTRDCGGLSDTWARLVVTVQDLNALERQQEDAVALNFTSSASTEATAATCASNLAPRRVAADMQAFFAGWSGPRGPRDPSAFRSSSSPPRVTGVASSGSSSYSPGGTHRRSSRSPPLSFELAVAERDLALLCEDVEPERAETESEQADLENENCIPVDIFG